MLSELEFDKECFCGTCEKQFDLKDIEDVITPECPFCYSGNWITKDEM